MLKHTLSEKKSLGVYYTPNDLSKVLCEWAIRTNSDVVLEPSFGGCGFLEASINRLSKLGNSKPESNVFGADIDPRAFHFLREKVGRNIQVKKKFILCDFIKLKPTDFSCQKFDVIIGNPPYVSIHNMSQPQRESCKNVLKESKYSENSLGSNANLWAFFLIHSLSFIKEKGRMAWVLPSSALHSDYAKRLLKTLEGNFLSLNLIRLHERIFKTEGADEVSVVLLAEGFQRNQTPANASYHITPSVAELSNLITKPSWQTQGMKDYKFIVIGEETAHIFSKYCNYKDSLLLGDVCDVKIGLVTGANKAFTLSYREALNHHINYKQLKPIITKFSQLKGLEHSVDAHEKLKSGDSRAYLLCPKKLVKDSSAAKYLSSFSKKEIESNRTFNKRPDWFNPSDSSEPDAFLTYMFDKVSLLVLNKDRKVNCTNSIHRVYFKEGISDIYRRAVSVAMLSSFSRLSVELVGRAYGSGVQKLEPTAAKNIHIILNDILVAVFNKHWGVINRLVMNGELGEANVFVDKLICQNCNRFKLNELEKMRNAAHHLRDCRYGVTPD